MPTHANPIDATAEWIELEPTGGPSAIAESWSPARGDVGLQFGAGASISTETNTLRRRRLGHVALFLSIYYGVLSIWNAISDGAPIWDIRTPYILRFALSVVVAVVALSRLNLSRMAAKSLEIGLFGGLTVILCLMQYWTNLAYIESGELLSAIAYSKNGVIQALILMVLYGMVMPNTARQTAMVVLTMAVALMTTFAVLIAHPAVAPIVRVIDRGEPVGTDLIIITVSAFLAIYGAHLINGLRRELHAARRFGQYQLGKQLGVGGMGEVYLAEHEMLKRPCALKLIRPEMNNAVTLARFEREVRSAARLSHPNTIEIYDYGHASDGTFYYVMEYLPGMSLEELVSRFGPLPPGRLIYLMRQACAGLAEAHSLGLIHRDLKPANIYVALRGGESDIAKVLDFGLVKLTNESGQPHLTADQTVSGTPLYMSPEQARGIPIDHRSDIYSLGAVAYYALTGRPPFVGETSMSVMIAHARDAVEAIRSIRPDAPADLEAVILRCLAKSPVERFKDVKELSQALGACAAAKEWDDERAAAWWLDAAKRAVQPGAAPRATAGVHSTS